MDSTTGFTSELTSFSLVCELKLGSGTFTESTAIMPSRMSSPEKLTLACLARPFCSTYWPMVRVSAARKPARWVPPSFCGMLLVKQNMVSW